MYNNVRITYLCAGIIVLIWAWISCVPVARGGMIMDTMEIPASDSHVWQLADAGASRYAEGWYPRARPITYVPLHSTEGGEQFPLRLPGALLNPFPFSTPIWRSPVTGQLAVVEQILMLWSLQIPEYPSGPLSVTIRERMLLVPRQLRIELAPVTVEVEERE